MVDKLVAGSTRGTNDKRPCTVALIIEAIEEEKEQLPQTQVNGEGNRKKTEV